MRPLPSAIDALRDVSELGVGLLHDCARREGGEVRCWGIGRLGGFGDGTLQADGVGGPVLRLNDAVQVAVGAAFSCARRGDSRVVCWGSATANELGDGLAPEAHALCPYTAHPTYCRPDPVEVVGVADAVEVVAGDEHACVRRAGGGVACWGGRSSTPRDIAGLTGVLGLAAGYRLTCARLAGGGVACWYIDEGIVRARPGFGEMRALAVGDHVCGVRADGRVLCSGGNGHGELGDGTRTPSDAAVVVAGLDDAVGIAAGLSSTCALRANGEVWCWGANFDNQLGRPCDDRANCDSLTPVRAALP